MTTRRRPTVLDSIPRLWCRRLAGVSSLWHRRLAGVSSLWHRRLAGVSSRARRPCHNRRPWDRSLLTVVLSATCLTVVLTTQTEAQWPQWGGPDGNFMIETRGLANTWPEDGPPKLWSREFGEGCSSIIVEDSVLYTMYRKEPTAEKEYTVALDAKTGKTLWEHGNPSPITAQMNQFGSGPHSTPLVVGNRLYSIGANLALHCFDKKTGKVIWKHDLLEEYDITVGVYGYSASPLAYKDMIILPIVGKKPNTLTLAAFDQATGRAVWKNQSVKRDQSEHGDYSTPVIITLDGEDQIVFFTNEQLVAFQPSDGKVIWRHPFPNQVGVNVSTPVWNGKDLLFCSAGYGAGARAIRLTRENGKTTPEELWHSKKMRMHHCNAILIGDHVYGSSGDFGPAFFMAMNLESGKPAWRKRGFSKANCVYGDGKFIILDEDGQLALATASPEGLTIHSKCTITERISWTSPTLVGKTLYIRDRNHIMALDLG